MTLRKTSFVAIAVYAFIVSLQLFVPGWYWESPLWYANISGIGGGLAVFLGSLLLLIRPFRKENEYLIVAASASIVAGVSEICGIFLNDVPVSRWLDCQAVLLGSLLLSAVWLSRSVIRKHLASHSPVLASAALVLLFSIWFILSGRWALAPGIADGPSLTQIKILKCLGGLMFLAALPRLSRVLPAEERGLLFTVTLYLGLGAVSSPFIRSWGLEWWLVLIVRNAVYLLAIRYALRTFISSQQALFESEERFKALFDAAPVGIGIIDNRNHAYQQANPALCRLIGFSQEELRHTSLKSIIFRDEIHNSFALRNKLFRGELSEYCTTRKHVTRDGRILWVKVRGTLLHLGKGSVQEFRMVEDVTSEKTANEKVATLVQELSRANAELEHFTSIASHDLKSPLRTVSNYVQLIARRLSGNADPELRELIAFAVDGCARMRNLIEDLLSYANVSKSAHRFSSVDCNGVLDEALRNLSLEIMESAAQIAAPELPTLSGDRNQLMQLFQNLVGNAIKYRDHRTPIVEVKVEEKEEEWLFSVSDNGIGFDMQYADKVFAEFQRLETESKYSGTGLGLPICKAIVNRHGGRIWAKSVPGEGSTFFFTIRKQIGGVAGEAVSLRIEAGAVS